MAYHKTTGESPAASQEAISPSAETKARLEELKRRLREIKGVRKENRKQYRQDLKVSSAEERIGRASRNEVEREGRRGRFFYQETANENEKWAKVEGQQENKWLRTIGRNAVDMAQIEGRSGRRLDRKEARFNRKLSKIEARNARVATRFDENGFRLNRKERKARLRQALADLNSAPPPAPLTYAQLAYPTFPDKNPSFDQFNRMPKEDKVVSINPSSTSYSFPWESNKAISSTPTQNAEATTHLERTRQISQALETANMGELDRAARLILSKDASEELRSSPDSKMLVIRQMQAKLTQNEVASNDVTELYALLKNSPERQAQHAERMRAISSKILSLKDQLTLDQIKALAVIMDPTAKERGALKDDLKVQTEILPWLINDPINDPQFYRYDQAEKMEKYLNGLNFETKVAQNTPSVSTPEKPPETSDKKPKKKEKEPTADELLNALEPS